MREEWPARSSLDAELAAIAQAYTALCNLDHQARDRALEYLRQRIDAENPDLVKMP